MSPQSKLYICRSYFSSQKNHSLFIFLFLFFLHSPPFVFCSFLSPFLLALLSDLWQEELESPNSHQSRRNCDKYGLFWDTHFGAQKLLIMCSPRCTVLPFIFSTLTFTNSHLEIMLFCPVNH